MRVFAVPARTWLLWAAPAMIGGGLLGQAGGAAAGLALWLALFPLLPQRRYPYPRKRRFSLSRLFFSAALTSCLSGCFLYAVRLMHGGSSFPLSPLMDLAGAVGFSLPLGAAALSPRVRSSTAWTAGALLTVLFLLFLFR